MKHLKIFFRLGLILAVLFMIPSQAFATAKSTAALQADLLTHKVRKFSPDYTFADSINLTDSLLNKTTDTLDDVADGTVNSLIPAADATYLGDLEADGVTVAELGLLDGSLEANTAASVAAILDTAKALRTNANVGTAGTGVTAVEYGDGYNHVTVLTLTAAALTPTIPADAEGAGVIIYTFPAGVHVFTGCHMDVTAVTADSATNAVDMGIGSLIASGDITTLSTAAMEDCVTGQTVADISSPATEKSTIATAGAPLLFEAGDSKVIHLNMAGTWNNTVATLDATGTITIYWTYLGA